MKKRLFYTIIVTVLMLSFCCSCFCTASAATIDARLLGIVYSGGGDRTSWQTKAATALEKIASSVTKYTAFTPSQFLSYLSGSAIFVVQTHGAQDNIMTVDSNGNESNVYISNINGLSTLSGVDIAFIGACNCGKGGASADNFINAIYNKGARFVIGYTVSVYTAANSIMLREFCVALGNTYPVSSALTYADAKVTAEYGSTGNTDNRLIRGSTGIGYAGAESKLGLGDTSDDSTDSDDIYYFITDDGDVYGFF